MITKVQTGKRHWIVQTKKGEVEIPFGFTSEDGELEKELSQWFSEGNRPEPLYTAIEKAKIGKLAEIEAAKIARFDEDVSVKIGNKNYTIIGGLEAYDKYTKAYDIAKRMGITKGKIVVREGVVEVTEAQMKKVLLALDTKNYRAEIKAGYLRESVSNAQTIEEVKAVAWDVQS